MRNIRRTRVEKESNYMAFYAEGITRRYQIEDDLPILELKNPEFFDIKLTSFCLGKCPNCFPPDTLINTPNGIIPIQDIIKGDIVLGDNKEICEQKTEQLFVREYQGEMIKIELEDGKTLSLTPNHQVYTYNREWVEAKDLTVEDDLKIISDY